MSLNVAFCGIDNQWFSFTKVANQAFKTHQVSGVIKISGLNS